MSEVKYRGNSNERKELIFARQNNIYGRYVVGVNNDDDEHDENEHEGFNPSRWQQNRFIYSRQGIAEARGNEGSIWPTDSQLSRKLVNEHN